MGRIKILKCCKCLNTSENSTVSFHRFLKPGKKNIYRAQLWAKWAYPDEDFSTLGSLSKLYNKNRFICSAHFAPDAFVEHEPHHLNRYSVPISALPPTHGKLREQPVILPTSTTTNFTSSSANNFVTFLKSSTVSSETQVSVSPSYREIHSPNNSPLVNERIGSLSSDQKTVKNCNSENVPPLSVNVSRAKKRKSNDTSDMPESKKCASSNKYANRTMPAQRKILKSINVSRVNQLSPRKAELYSECKRYRKKLSNFKWKNRHLKYTKKLKNLAQPNSIVDEIARNMTPAAAIFFSAQIQNKPSTKPKGRRWTFKQKLLALSIYKKSPSCYNLLRKMFVLPSPASLKLLLSTICLETGICENLLCAVKRSVNKMKKGNEQCILMFDEIAIRRHVSYNRQLDQINGFEDHGTHGRRMAVASQAMVFMLVGIKKRWKQPIAYYFSSKAMSADRLQVIIKEVLHACFSHGLEVVSTVCDMGTNNTAALNALKRNENDSFFTFGDKKITTIYDAPHMLKAFRNMFMKYNIAFQIQSNIIGLGSTGIAKWEHVKSLFDRDQKTVFKMAPKLSKSHIMPGSKQKMKVSAAAHIISHTVAASLHTLSDTTEAFAKSSDTANLLKNMDTVFDSLNGSLSNKKCGKEFRGVLSRRSRHLELWSEQKKIIKSMKFLNNGKRQPPSKDGWIITINAVEHIWKILQNRGFNYLETRRLNQDPLENFFGNIRYVCGSNGNPNQQQFEGAFKTNLLTGLTYDDLRRGNCQKDGLFFLDNLQTLLEASYNKKNEERKDHNVFKEYRKHVSENYASENSSAESELKNCMLSSSFVSGFVVHSLYTEYSCIRNCDDCSLLLTASILAPHNAYIFNREYSSNAERLVYPSCELVECVVSCSNAIENFLQEHAALHNIKEKVTQNLQNCEDIFEWLDCKEHKEICKSFIIEAAFHIKIKFWCKCFNESLQEEKRKKAERRRIKIFSGW